MRAQAFMLCGCNAGKRPKKPGLSISLYHAETEGFVNTHFNFILDLCHGFGALPNGSGDALRSSMEAENARWLSAFNTQNVEKLQETYTADAVLIPPGAPITNGPRAIGEFWHARMKAGVRDHTFEILNIYSDGKYTYQITKWTAVVVKAHESIPLSGSNLRVFEHQSDGSWKVKAHIFVRD
jgi:ketosteroid isomerase-like protein